MGETARNSSCAVLLTVLEAAQVLKVHPSTVRRIIWRGSLPVVSIGVALRIEPEDLRFYVEGQKWRQVMRAGGRFWERLIQMAEEESLLER